MFIDMDKPAVQHIETCELCKKNKSIKFLPIITKPEGWLIEYGACEVCFAKYVTDEALERQFDRLL